MVRLKLRDDQWERIGHLLPGKASDRGRTGRDNRLFVEAILWLARSGAPWRDLPAEFGNWNSAYQRFARWQKRGVWSEVFEELAKDAEFEGAFIDSPMIRAAGVPQKMVSKRSATPVGGGVKAPISPRTYKKRQNNVRTVYI